MRRRKVVPLVSGGGLPSLVEQVAGGPVKGSWWGHPKGALIYELENILFDSSEILGTKWVDGKVTFIHNSLWPALYRVVSDPSWRKAKTGRLDAAARRLLIRTEKKGEIRVEATERKSREALSRDMLALSYNVHTVNGNHATIMVSWHRWASPRLRRLARKLDFAQALSALRAAAGGSAHGLEPRAEARSSQIG